MLKKIRDLFLSRYWFEVGSCRFNLIFTVFVCIVYNAAFFKKFFEVVPSAAFAFWGVLCLVLLLNAACNILMFKYTTKFWAVLFVLLNTVALYFMMTYNVYIDKFMLLNVLETDAKEIDEILSFSMIAYFVVFALVPLVLLWKTKIMYAPLGREIVRRIVVVVISLIIVAGIVLAGYKNTAQFARNNRHIRYLLVPVNYIGAVITIVKIKTIFENPNVEKIGEDAVFEKYWKGNKKLLLVWVVGETARTANWGMSGYERNTTEPLDEYKNEIINFSKATSCGTATGVSLPCMFDKDQRKDFRLRKSFGRENVLDVLGRAGVKVWWRNNNSGCKGLCARVENDEPCKDEKGCYDDVLLGGLKSKILSENKNMMVVLHQKGSHGPTYAMRYPEEFERYVPACKTERLDKCSNEEIVNVYDNTIYYTAHNLAGVIEEIKGLKNDYEIVFMYASDHGESLGENGIYLHAAPYLIAPDEQKEVPFFFWMTKDVLTDLKIDKKCVLEKKEEKISHDNLFHTVLGLFGVKTKIYDKELDIFAKCRID